MYDKHMILTLYFNRKFRLNYQFNSRILRSSEKILIMILDYVCISALQLIIYFGEIFTDINSSTANTNVNNVL